MAEFKIDSKELRAALDRLSDSTNKEIKTAARRGLNRALTHLKKETAKQLGDTVRMKSKDIKARIVGSNKAITNDLAIAVYISGKPLSAIRFLQSPKGYVSQKGVPVKKRKLLKISIIKGKTITLKHSFLSYLRAGSTRGDSATDTGNLHIAYRPTGVEQGPVAKKSAVSLATLIQSQKLVPKVLASAKEMFTKSFNDSIAYLKANRK